MFTTGSTYESRMSNITCRPNKETSTIKVGEHEPITTFKINSTEFVLLKNLKCTNCDKSFAREVDMTNHVISKPKTIRL